MDRKRFNADGVDIGLNLGFHPGDNLWGDKPVYYVLLSQFALEKGKSSESCSSFFGII